MMSLSKVAAAWLALAVMATSAAGAPPIYGNWKGKIKLDLSQLPGSSDPKNKALVAQRVAQVEAATVNLNIAKNGTFTMKVTGSPVPTQNSTQTGKWVLKGNQLSLVANQKGVNMNALTVSKDGKTISVFVMGKIARLTFTR